MHSHKPMLQDFDKLQVQRSFNVASSAYNQFTSLQRDIGENLLTRYHPSNSPPKAILDVGSGTGFLTTKLQAAYSDCSITALDLSLGMLQQSQQAGPDKGGVDYLCGDAEALPIGEETMDHVFSNLAFQWCPSLKKTFSECNRVLQREGVFVFSTFGPQTLIELREAWAAADNDVHVNTFVSMREIERELKATGFERITLFSENIVLHYDSVKDVMRGLKGMGAHNINRHRKRGLTGVSRFNSVQAAYKEKRCARGFPATFQAVYAVCHKPSFRAVS